MPFAASKNAPRPDGDLPPAPTHRTLLQRAVVGVVQWPPGVRLYRRTLKALFGLHLHGLEHIPAQRPLLLVSNHGSHYDGLFLRVISAEILGAPAVSVTWGGVRHYPFAPAVLAGRALNLILTHEESDTPGTRASVLDQIIAELREGGSVALNPEGDRFDELARFHPGAAYAALQTGVPIVPMTLRGVQGLWSKNLGLPNRWHGRVSAHFHPAVDPADYAGQPWREAVAALTAVVRARIASALDYADSETGEERGNKSPRARQQALGKVHR